MAGCCALLRGLIVIGEVSLKAVSPKVLFIADKMQQASKQEQSC
jgi:hypothetical protein